MKESHLMEYYELLQSYYCNTKDNSLASVSVGFSFEAIAGQLGMTVRVSVYVCVCVSAYVLA